MLRRSRGRSSFTYHLLVRYPDAFGYAKEMQVRYASSRHMLVGARRPTALLLTDA